MDAEGRCAITTIAYKNGVLAGDSRITEGDAIYTNRQRKVHRLRDGRLVGWSGSLVDSKRFLKALRAGEEVPPKLNVAAIVVQPDGKVRLYDERAWLEMPAYYAIGSGSHFAIGAMAAGASAAEAVKIAIKHDTGSGGRVQTLTLEK